jgi:cleavage and polyadenylation specificity factor subunit 1
VTDSLSNRHYLVNTGSAFSIMPWQSSSPLLGPGLWGADGCRIPCWGEQLFIFTIGRVPRQWVFLLAAVSFPILGIDFLRHHSLVVDVVNLWLLSPLPRVSTVVPVRSYAKAMRSPSAGSSLP